MTEKRPISILLMDDEINSLVIQATIQHLNNQGFDVDFAHTMSEAIEAYYQHYYDVFILDIDGDIACKFSVSPGDCRVRSPG